MKEYIFEKEFPSFDELVNCIQSLQSYCDSCCGDNMVIVTPKGEISVSKFMSDNGYYLRYPKNYNQYKFKLGTSAKTMARVIQRDIDVLSWAEFHYVHPEPFVGDDPRTLDELCVYYQQLRQKPRVSQNEKYYVLKSFADLIFEETKKFSDILDMPFKTLLVYSGGYRTIARYDWVECRVSFNSNFFFHDADSIRQTIVHELCHSRAHGHGMRFSSIMEESMLKCGLISRPCVCSPQLIMGNYSGARFPVGKYCPGYNFLKGIKGELPSSKYLGKNSDRIIRIR